MATAWGGFKRVDLRLVLVGREADGNAAAAGPDRARGVRSF
jgi:hypothetical protein